MPTIASADEPLVQAIFQKAKASNRTLREDEVWDLVRRHSPAS